MFLKCWDLGNLKKFPRKPLKQSHVTIKDFLTAALQTLLTMYFVIVASCKIIKFWGCLKLVVVAYKPVAY